MMGVAWALAELTTYVSRWQAVMLNAPPIAYASMSDENPSMAIEWLKKACDKLVNIADWVLPIKESYSIAAGSDYDTGQRLTWTQRTLRGVTAVATAIVAVKVGRIAVKAGARVLGWVVETRAGKVVKKVVKRLAQPIADRLEKRASARLTKKSAEEVGKLFNGSVRQANTGKGWKIKISKDGNEFLIRIMDAGSGQRTKPYFRVSIKDKGVLDLSGKLSNDQALTHIDITPNYMEQINQMINRYMGVK